MRRGETENIRYVVILSSINVVLIIAIKNPHNKKNRKSSNAKHPLFIFNSTATREPFLMLRCTIQLLSHDLTQHQHNLYQHNHATSPNIATPFFTSVSYQIIQPPSPHVLIPGPHLPMFLTFRNTILSIHSHDPHRYTEVSPYLFLRCESIPRLDSGSPEQTFQ